MQVSAPGAAAARGERVDASRLYRSPGASPAACAQRGARRAQRRRRRAVAASCRNDTNLPETPAGRCWRLQRSMLRAARWRSRCQQHLPVCSRDLHGSAARPGTRQRPVAQGALTEWYQAIDTRSSYTPQTSTAGSDADAAPSAARQGRGAARKRGRSLQRSCGLSSQ